MSIDSTSKTVSSYPWDVKKIRYWVIDTGYWVLIIWVLSFSNANLRMRNFEFPGYSLLMLDVGSVTVLLLSQHCTEI